MKKPNNISIAFALALSASLLFAAQLPAAAKKKEAECLDCHAAIKTKKVIHAAVDMGCPSCHEAPHAKKKAELSLTAPVPDLCCNCHDKGMITKKIVHPPVADGQCTYCHNPHSSDNASILTQPVQELCAGCHDKQSSGRHIM